MQLIYTVRYIKGGQISEFVTDDFGIATDKRVELSHRYGDRVWIESAWVDVNVYIVNPDLVN